MKPIPNFPNYSITKDGRVWSTPRNGTRGGWIKSFIGVTGYIYINLYGGKGIYQKKIHRLILETFVGPCPSGMEACHNNGIKTDNKLENLRWDTKSANIKEAVLCGSHPSAHQNGEDNPRAKLTEDKVMLIRYLRDVAKFTLKDIAWQFDVHISTIGRICQRKTWKYLDAKI